MLEQLPDDEVQAWSFEIPLTVVTNLRPSSVAVDAEGNVFVAGSSAGDVITWKITQDGATFARGDANGDMALNISDPVFILDDLFVGNVRSRCRDAADVNDDGKVTITDPINLLGVLFRTGDPPRAPRICGTDPTADRLGCDSVLVCGVP